MVKPSIFVTRRWPEIVEHQLARDFNAVFNLGDKPLNASEFRDAIKNFDAVLPTVTDKLGSEVFDVNKARTKILGNYGIGYSHICEASVQRLGVTVTNTPDMLSECTADVAMTLMLMTSRRASEGEREVRTGAWTGWHPTHLIGTKVSGKTLGIVGFGRIGREVARRAHHGFGMKILVQNCSLLCSKVLAEFDAIQAENLEELLPQCDFVSLHCSGDGKNRHLINAKRLGLMKPNAFLINTAQGKVIDERALVQALTFETIGGAGLDVFDGEPHIAPDLYHCDKLVMLPHLGSATREAREAMGFRVLDNLKDFFEGRDPRDRVI